MFVCFFWLTQELSGKKMSAFSLRRLGSERKRRKQSVSQRRMPENGRLKTARQEERTQADRREWMEVERRGDGLGSDFESTQGCLGVPRKHSQSLP